MNVLMIYPEFPDTFWSFKHALRFVRKRAAFPPLGLLTVAALLPEDWNERLIDLNVRKLRDSDLDWADCVLVSAMAIQRASSRTVIARCKAKGLLVVAGGPLFTSEYEEFPEVDHFVLNEAEITLPAFLADLRNDCARRVYASDDYPEVTSTPTPRWELADMKRYASMSIQYSRGCPYNCDFCNVTALFGRRVRTKSAAQVLEELQGLYAAGWRGDVFFVDDNFIGNRAKLKRELLPALIAWQDGGRKLSFHTEVSIDLADDEELMRMMVTAGFHTVFVGIETPEESSLAECSKRQNSGRDLVADVKKVQRHGLQVQGGFIVGFDHDSATIFQRQIDFIQRSGIVTAMVGMLQAPPGTRLYDRLHGENRILGHSSGDNVDGTTNILPAMGLEKLHAGYKEILRHIYSPREYYARLKTFLSEYQPPEIRPRITREQILALFRSMVRLGIVGRERVHYWRLLFWLNRRRHRRALLPVAVTLAIYGHHFRKVCKLHVL